MDHTAAIDVWNGSNRVSQLWEALLAERVTPDPCVGKYRLPRVEREPAFPMEPCETKKSPLPSADGQKQSPVPALLEKAGFESLRRIRQALEILAAPSEEDPAGEAGHGEMGVVEVDDPLRIDSTVGLTFIKVSREPEAQPGSAIDTRRMAYGLKIPTKPLHKRPIYQRIFFSLRHIVAQGKDKTSP